MKPNDGQTWNWDSEHEAPESFTDALLSCPFVFQIHLPKTIIEGYAESIVNSGNVTVLKRPIIDFTNSFYRDAGPKRYVQHPTYFIVNAPVLYWPRPRKESP